MTTVMSSNGVADPKASVDDLQKALNWACGVGGADCSPIQPNQPCFDPNTVADHASYAFNMYWQVNKKKGGICSFEGTAQLVSTDPRPWLKFWQVVRVFRERGLVLTPLLGLSVFLSMMETLIATLRPWKVHGLGEPEMVSSQCFIVMSLVSLLAHVAIIGTTTLFAKAATTICFGEAGVSAATGVMSVVVLLFTGITQEKV
ncbi:Glucan endo-1,3-beta-glucosidase 12 [Acorus calamus]|uniref:Glucan endo-1,3-beta-glucosidase 12 n=1 Tax=Acorus calamus TaxID=4465 RepID=A0AAV9DD86_ACOCL|nr:Glucan endo-1,3-beta-glucosidase 12 [Acorus calamus]